MTGTFLYGSEVRAVEELTGLFDRLSIANASKQIVVVSTDKEGEIKASLEAFEKTSEGWVKSFPSMKAVVGEKGFSTQKIEGDKKAPAGVFRIGKAFGIPDTPSITKLPYKNTTNNDYWIDDETSPDYNTWVEYDKNPQDRWKSFERLRIPLYKYAIVIEYNMNPVVKGKGSAIFLHLWKDSNTSTSGCTGVSETDILKLLGWLDPDKNPIIVQGTKAMIADISKTTHERVLYPINVRLNDKDIAFDVYPRIVNGRTLVPVRAIFEDMGAVVSWEGATKTVRILKDSTEIELAVGSKSAYVGEKEVSLDVPALILDGRMLVPVRFIAEGLGFKVGWDEETRSVLIDTLVKTNIVQGVLK